MMAAEWTGELLLKHQLVILILLAYRTKINHEIGLSACRLLIPRMERWVRLKSHYSQLAFAPWSRRSFQVGIKTSPTRSWNAIADIDFTQELFYVCILNTTSIFDYSSATVSNSSFRVRRSAHGQSPKKMVLIGRRHPERGS